MFKRILVITTLLLAVCNVCFGASVALYPRFRALDSNGDPLAKGYVYTYEPGTTTPRTTYTDITGQTANANPVVLDNYGEADIYLDGLTKFVIKKKVGSDYVTVHTVDNVGPSSLISTTGRIYRPDYNETDQGAVGSVGGTVKDIIDQYGSGATQYTIYFENDSGGVTTAYTFTTAETIPSNVTLEFENGAMLKIDVGGGSYVIIQGGIKAGIKQQIFDIVSGQAFPGAGNIETVWGHWWGIDGSSDQEAINAGILFANRGETKFRLPWGQYYYVDDSIYIPTGSNNVAMADDGETGSYAFGSKGLIIWDGADPSGVSEVIVKIDRQVDSYIGGLSVSAWDPDDTLVPGIIGFLIYDSALNSGTGSIFGYTKFDRLKAKSCDIGMLAGNYNTATVTTDSNGYWQGGDTNFNHCVWEFIHTYQCVNPLIFDALQSDNNGFYNCVFGSGSARIESDHNIHVKRCGNQLTFDKLMFSGDNIKEDNTLIQIDDGDGIISDCNFESGVSKCLIEISNFGGRGTWELRNIRMANFYDTSLVAARIRYYGGVLIENCTFTGDVTYTEGITAIGNVFVTSDLGRATTGFIASGDGDIQEFGTRFKTTTYAVSPRSYITNAAYLDTDALTVNILEMYNKTATSAILTDETDVDILNISCNLGSADFVSIRGFYSIGNYASLGNICTETGEFSATIIKDNADNFTTNIVLGTTSQALDGYASLDVTWSIDTTVDASGATATLVVNQNNENLDSSLRGQFSFEVLDDLLRDDLNWAF